MCLSPSDLRYTISPGSTLAFTCSFPLLAFDLAVLGLVLALLSSLVCRSLASSRLRLVPVLASLEKCTWLDDRPCSLTLLLRVLMARLRVPASTLSPSGLILLSSASSSWMVLSTVQLEFGFPWSPSTRSIPLAWSCWSGLPARDWRAAARSVLTSTLAPCLMGVTTARMARVRSSLVSGGVRVAVAKLENLSQLTTMSWEAQRSTLTFMWVPGWAGAGWGV